MTVNEICEQAARELPAGWVIEIYVEQGSAGVRLEGPDGDGVQCDFSNMVIEEQIIEAIRKAREEVIA